MVDSLVSVDASVSYEISCNGLRSDSRILEPKDCLAKYSEETHPGKNIGIIMHLKYCSPILGNPPQTREVRINRIHLEEIASGKKPQTYPLNFFVKGVEEAKESC